MAGATPTLFWYDRFDDRIGTLTPTGAVTHTEELGGEDTIEFESWDVPEKGDRLVWHDDLDGVWREFCVVRTDEPLEGMCRVYAESSLCELLDDFVKDKVPNRATATAALTAALAGSRWAVGTCANLGFAGCWLYHMNALAALRKVCDTWGGEAEGVITVANGRVAMRTLSIVRSIGSWRGARFSYGKNLSGCTRTVLEDEVYTALYGFGAGLPNIDEQGAVAMGTLERRQDGQGPLIWPDNVQPVRRSDDASRSDEGGAFPVHAAESLLRA